MLDRECERKTAWACLNHGSRAAGMTCRTWPCKWRVLHGAWAALPRLRASLLAVLLTHHDPLRGQGSPGRRPCEPWPPNRLPAWVALIRITYRLAAVQQRFSGSRAVHSAHPRLRCCSQHFPRVLASAGPASRWRSRSLDSPRVPCRCASRLLRSANYRQGEASPASSSAFEASVGPSLLSSGSSCQPLRRPSCL